MTARGICAKTSGTSFYSMEVPNYNIQKGRSMSVALSVASWSVHNHVCIQQQE
jgi:hypothetical protein